MAMLICLGFWGEVFGFWLIVAFFLGMIWGGALSKM